jgi:hypothetical protein
MKQLFEAFLGVCIIMFIAFIGVQLVLTNTQISTAREYHETVIERIENSGMDTTLIQQLTEETNNDTNYKLEIEEVDGYSDSTRYRVSLTYAVSSPIYEIFSKSSSTQYATIDGYASVGGNTPKTTATMEEKHGSQVDKISLDESITATLYHDGYLIIEGNGDLTVNSKDNLNGVKDKVTNISILNDIKNIPSHYFENYKNLEGIYLGEINVINSYAFSGCDKLNSINIPNSTTDISEYAFGNCAELTTIYVDCKETKISINENATINSNKFEEYIFLR